MHYGIITYGSRGDVQPYLALSIGLMERGHSVTLFANENFSSFAENFGIPFYPLPGNIEEMVHSPEVLHVLQSGNIIGFFRELQKMSRIVQPRVNAVMLAGCAKPDVLVASPLATIWIYSIAEKLNKNWAMVQLSLPTVPTKQFPFVGFSFFNTAWYNLFTYRLIRYIYWRLNKKDINEHRKSLELPILKESILKEITEKKILNLYAFSASLIERPKDWPAEVDITGFLTIPEEKRKQLLAEEPPVGMTQWLQNGEAPIYVGFGSIPIPDTKKFAAIIGEILEKTNHRIIFCQGWSELPSIPPHERLFVVKLINHTWLFPQCKTAIIHGGIGTIAAVLSARIPVIIVSIFGDQPLWGKLIATKRLGIHMPFKKLTTKKLLVAISKSQTFKIKQQAFIAGESMRREDGLRRAIDALEVYFKAKK
ncbi:MAG TPA: glycosyltransferase [Puia sp.]|jgi:sterol 3beta-glucosyltransferase|nr:glycosyltransferase [Puia sp.]